MTQPLRFSILFLALCGFLLGGASQARADDPGDDFPPPTKGDEGAPPVKADPKAEPAKAAPTKTEPAKAEPARAPAKAPWSPPAATPGPSRDLSSLPPPRVVRRRGRMPARSTVPARNATPLARTPSAPIRDVPAVRDVPSRRPLPAPPAPPAGDRSTSPRQPARTPPSATVPAGTGVGGSRVFGIAKTHNVALDRVPGQPQELALQFDVDYEVGGQAGRDVHVAIWFARAENNTLVTSSLPAYGDASGNLTLQTRSARVGGTSARYKASLRIPYRAFPIAAGESSYDVEARVQILRSEANGRVTILCRGKTTFRVYGFEEGAADGEAPGAAVANEDGTITDGR